MYYDFLRWYDPTTGRFISLDPLAGTVSDPQSQNGYAYARDLPTVLTDPTGAAFDCGEMPCEGSGARSPFWEASDINYAKIGATGNSQLLENCVNNPGLCASFLKWEGYVPDEFLLSTVDSVASEGEWWGSTSAQHQAQLLAAHSKE